MPGFENVSKTSRKKRDGNELDRYAKYNVSNFIMSGPDQLILNRVPSWGHIFLKTLGKFSNI
jgi:hypothetical protein